MFRKQNFQEDWVIRLIEEQAFLYGPSKFHYKSLVCSIWISETIAWLCSCCQIEFCIPYCRVWSFIFHLKFKFWGTLCFSSHEDTGAYLSNICANDVQTLHWRVQKPCCKKRSHGYKKSRSCKVGLMLTSSRVWVEEMPFFSHEERCYMKLSIFEASKDRDSWGVKLRPIYRQIISDLI